MTILVETFTPKLEIDQEKGVLILFKKINGFISQYGKCDLTLDQMTVMMIHATSWT